TKVRVALTGTVYVAPEGTAFPASISEAPGEDWVDLGYTTEDGVEFTFGKEVTNILGWQTRDPLRKLVTEEPKSFSMTLRQLETATFTAAFGGEVTEDPGATGEYEWHPPAAGSLPVQAAIVEFVDEDVTYRFCFRRTSDEGEKTSTLVASDAVNVPLAPAVLAASPDAWFVQTDDPNVAPA